MAKPVTIPCAFSRRFVWAGGLLGFAIGGFFDGILLHQILQWHHLLSGLEGEAFSDLRVQILADGLFHALMYVLGAVGLWLLYRSRAELTGALADRNLVANVLIGFGVWHVVDAVFAHWLTGIHRIRMDVPDPLLWDLGWLAIFGLPPLIAGILMKRHQPRQVIIADRRGNLRQGVAAMLALLTLVFAGWSVAPPSGLAGEPTVTVVLRPDVSPAAFLQAVGDSDARVLWSDRAGAVWVLTRSADIKAFQYYRTGALYVGGTVAPAGCSSWLVTPTDS